MQMPVGMPTLGGTLATQGGLVFIAGTRDYYLRAFDSSTGKKCGKRVSRWVAGRTYQLCITENRQTVHSDLCRRCTPVAGSW